MMLWKQSLKWHVIRTYFKQTAKYGWSVRAIFSSKSWSSLACDVVSSGKQLPTFRLISIWHNAHKIPDVSSWMLDQCVVWRRMRWAEHAARMGERRGAYAILVGKPEGKRPRRRWEDNIKWIFRKWDDGAWTGLIWHRIGTGGGLL